MKVPRLFPMISRRDWVWLAAGSMVFAMVFCYPMLCTLGYLGPGLMGWLDYAPDLSHLARLPANGDWDMFTDLRWVVYRSISHFHQFPFWNPYKCGGMSLIGNPESSILTPFVLLDLLAGPVFGLYLQIVLHLALAFAGGYVLARAMGMRAVSSLVLPTTYCSCSWIYLQLSMGNLNLALSFAYWPWMLALFYMALERRRILLAAGGGVLLALVCAEGNYTFVYAVLMVGSLAIALSVMRLSAWPLILAAVIVVFGAALSAPKLMASAQFLSAYPRPHADVQIDTLKLLPTFLFSRDQDLYRAGVPMIFAAYGAYVSLPIVALSLVGLLIFRRRAIPWLVPAALFLALARGPSGPYSAWALLCRLPLFQNLAFPSRFIFPFVFCLSVFAAEGADYLVERFPRRGGAVAMILFGIAIADAWTVGAPNMRYLFHNPIVPIAETPNFRQLRSDAQAMTELNEAGYGALYCWGYGWGNTTAVLGANQPGYKGEYYLLGAGSLQQSIWSPNRLTYDVDLGTPGSMVINQNYFPGWRLIEGQGMVYSEHGLIAVNLPASRQRLTLCYRPPHVILAFFVMLAAICGLVSLWLMDL